MLYVSIAVASMIYTKTVRVRNTDVKPPNTDNGEGSSEAEGQNRSGDRENAGRSAKQPVKTLLSVPLITQKDYPTGCESVTSVMALHFAGYDISVEEFIDEYLKIGKYYAEDGQYYGNSPYSCFIGNPRTGSGFGCFAPVIHDALVLVAGSDRVRHFDRDVTESAHQGVSAKWDSRHYLGHHGNAAQLSRTAVDPSGDWKRVYLAGTGALSAFGRCG